MTEEEAASQSERSREMGKFNQAVAEINDEDNLVFEGEQRGGHWVEGPGCLQMCTLVALAGLGSLACLSDTIKHRLVGRLGQLCQLLIR